MKMRQIFSVATFAALFAACGLASAQSQQTVQQGYTPPNDYPPPVTSQTPAIAGGNTIQGSARAGTAAMIQAQGQYNYNTSLANRQNIEAERQAIDNRLYAERIYFEMRRLNQEAWLAQNPRSTPEQIIRINQARLPRRLSTAELDPTWGTIYWPAVLQHAEFDRYRAALNDIFAHRADEHFGMGTPVYHQVQQLTNDMRAQLNREFATMSQMEWIQANRFIESLGYEARFPSSDVPNAPPAVAMNQ